MDTDYAITKPEDHHHDAIYELLGGDETGIPLNDPRHPLQVTDAILAAAGAPDSKSGAWLACFKGTPVGMITTRDLGGGVVVNAAHRRKGLGTSLVQAREAFFAETLGMEESRVPMRYDNMKSRKMHEDMGYKLAPESVRLIDSEAEVKDGDVIYMVKSLRPSTGLNIKTDSSAAPARTK